MAAFTRTLAVAAGFLAMLGLGSGTASAQNAHFISAGPPSISGDGNLTVSFKEAGLGGGGQYTYLLSADSASAIYQCFNHGGNMPQGVPFAPVNGIPSVNATFPASKNGSVTQTLTLDEPDAPPADSCKGSSQLCLTSVSFSGVKLEDQTTGDTATFNGTYGITGVFCRETD